MQRFVHSEVASGVVLIAAAVVALLIANSPLATSYHDLLHAYVGVTAGSFELKNTVLHWINDGLMALFFFLIGLELKREALAGELTDRRNAVLPVFAALGGALLPALIYTLITRGGPGASGWGIPMATDIAFSLGILALVGSRVPWALKVFLTAVAVIDDLLAVLVIALFYSGGIDVTALVVGLGILLLLLLANISGFRAVAIYVVLGLVVWLAFLQSGVHATIAGMLVALTIPARNRIDAPSFLKRARDLLAQFEGGRMAQAQILTDEQQQSAVQELEDACEAVLSPLQRLEHNLHPWVTFGIVPVFALANAGVSLSGTSMSATTLPVMLGVVLGLVVGKPFGLLGATWLALRLRVAALPEGVQWRHVVGVGCLAGLGFTMSLFIGTLGLSDPALLEAAKLGIIAASLVAGLSGFILLRWGSHDRTGQRAAEVIAED